ncbi:peptidase inhibitor family I36 protein (plasmid) [Streptomyces sp. NBC_01450]|uniref:peptidase inhibitor family I36 protein n=1 Tax=Streptomyces sp. NBC_01450 TaxID=2903871 RepID=UPI002E3421D4|nr:peptidase inhibitor family I36 protein [Streptomyces sp. NBC_01450]
MKAKKKLAMVLAPTLSAIAMTVGGAGSASAAASNVMAYTCQDNEVCLYHDRDFTGSVFVPDELKYRSAVQDFGVRNFVNGTNANEAVSSVKNTTGWTFCFYDNPHLDHYEGSIGPDTNMTFVGGYSYLNDIISSMGPC